MRFSFLTIEVRTSFLIAYKMASYLLQRYEQKFPKFLKIPKSLFQVCILPSLIGCNLQSVKILFYPIFLAKSYFVLFFGKCPILSYFFRLLKFHGTFLADLIEISPRDWY